MKRLTLLFLLCLFITSTFAQTQRNKVVLEVMTGTWCVFCPGWALAADDFHLNGDDVAVIEYHVGDAYQTNSALARDGYYNATGYPTAIFDGTDQSSGGHASLSVYNQNYNRYTSAIGVGSPIDMDMNWAYDTINQNFTLNVMMEQVSSLPAGASPVLHLAITESHIPANWFGLTEIKTHLIPAIE